MPLNDIPPDAEIARLLTARQVSGAAIATSAHGVITERLVGARPVSQAALLPGTLFQVASLTKPLCAYLALLLVDDGILDLDTPLFERYADPAIGDAAGRAITPRHVLTHTTGLPNWREETGDATLIPASAPGTRFTYSGEAFEYLQRAIEHITGRRLADLARERIFAPLHMPQSRLQWGLDADGAERLDRDGIAESDGSATIASAAWSLLSTAGEYARFVQAVLEPVSAGAAALRPQTRAAMLTAGPTVGARRHIRWGLGWGLQDTDAGRCAWHWGGPQNGYASYAAAQLDHGYSVVILTNGERGFEVCRELAEGILGVAQPAFEWILPVDDWRPTG